MRGGLLLVLLLSASLSGATPILQIVAPRGAQQGSEITLDLRGARIGDALGLFLYRPGIEVLGVEKKSDRRVLVRIRIAPDCPLGAHPLRLRTATGISNLRLFHVGPLPQLAEKEPNGAAAQAQPIPIGVTVEGRITAEDVDWFALEPESDVDLSLEVQGVRLGDGVFDPYLAVRDSSGELLYECDDSSLGRMDPLLICRLEGGRRYLVELRETAYGGAVNAFYRFHVGTFPRPIGAVPAGGRPGEEIELIYVGEGPALRSKVRIPKDARQVWEHHPSDDRGTAPTPIRLAVSNLVNVVEAAAPTEGEAAPEKAEPLRFAVPAAINGIIAVPGEVDQWRFKASKGQDLDIRVRARELRSPLDAVIEIRDAKGKRLAANDDSGGPDSRLRFRVASDGECLLRIRDHLGAGSPLHFYRVEVAQRRSSMESRVHAAARLDVALVPVPRGGRMGALLRGLNVPVSHQVRLIAEGLPPGVAAEIPPFVAGTSLIPAVFSAEENAPLGGTLARIGALAGRAPKRRDPGFRQTVQLVRVRNDQPYVDVVLDRLAVAVCEPVPFSLDLVAPKVPLVQGGPLSLKIVLRRDKGFTARVRIQFLGSVPGVRAGGLTIPGNKSEARLPLNANTKVPPGAWKIAVLGIANTKVGPVSASSALVDLRTAKPWVTLSLGKARGEQGKKVELDARLKWSGGKSLDGKVRAEILNLPRGVTAAFPEIDAKTERFSYELELGPKAAPGRHRGLIVRLKIPSAGGVVTHVFRSGELRIDRPLPPRPAAATAKSPAAAKTPAKGAKGTIKEPGT